MCLFKPQYVDVDLVLAGADQEAWAPGLAAL